MMSLMLFLAFRKDYTAKLEQSEKRARDLCAELAVEEQSRQELARIVGELLPESSHLKPKDHLEQEEIVQTGRICLNV